MILANAPQLYMGSYRRHLTAGPPIILIGYAKAISPALTAPAITAGEGMVLAGASFTDLGLGGISRCGFMVRNVPTPTPYIKDGFENGSLDGFTISSTNTTLEPDKIVVIDTATTNGISSKYAAKLCSSGDSQTSKLTCSVSGPLEFSFAWKVSCESRYDTLNWHLDGVLQDTISGEVDWQVKTVSLTQGNHAIDFAYSKDNGRAIGQDCGWIDDVTFGMTPPVYYDANLPTEVGQVFTARLTDLPLGVSYIAAFAENPAGRTVSGFVAYRNSAGWEGGILCGLQPNAFTHFVVGGTEVSRSKVHSVIVGNTVL